MASSEETNTRGVCGYGGWCAPHMGKNSPAWRHSHLLQVHHSAFTLVEVLVVTAILSLLISILLPATTAARRTTRTALCGTTLRELARGWAIYGDEHAGTLISGRPVTVPGTNNLYWVGNGWKYRPRWYASLGAAVAIYAFDKPRTDNVHQPIDHRLLICPEVPGWVSEKNASYGYNFQFLGNSRKVPGHDRFINFPVQDSRILGDTVVAADSLGTAAHFPASERRPNLPKGTSDIRSLGFHAFMLDPPRLTPDSDTCDNDNPGYRGGPDARHNGKANFAFADGHVELSEPQQLGYGLRPDGSYEFEGPLVTNRRFSGTGRDDDPPSIRPD